MILSLKDVKFGYDDSTVLEDVNADINPKDRIGVVGTNGAGKSTLLYLMLKKLQTTEGEVFHKTGLRCGFLEQGSGLNSESTVYEEMLSVFYEVLEAEEKLRRLEQAMGGCENAEYRALVKEYEQSEAFYNSLDGYNIEVKIKSVLNGMGFSEMYSQIINSMSGGEKTRLALAKLLLTEPELLVLDEPTNHLDFTVLTWLEKYLATYKGALVVVSHDRYFLDKVSEKIWDVEDKTLTTYRGNYTKYKELKKERIQYRLKEYEKQSRQVEHMLDYAQRNIARASTSNSAKSRLHRLANMEIIEEPRTYTRSPRFNFTFKRESVAEVMTVNKLRLCVENKVLCEDVSFTVRRGERIALIGANGTGKSTLIKTIAGLKGDTYGKIIQGKNVCISYYDQEHLNLNVNNTVLNELWFRHTKYSQTEVRSRLAALLLFEDDINKAVGVLSGGERAKLGLAITIAEEGNTLILDEPTNHLDLNSREALEEGLKNFEGTILFVSHDRYLINSLATRIFEIADRTFSCYEGNFESYAEQKRQAEPVQKNKPDTKADAKQESKKAFRTSKQRSDEVRIKQRIQALELLIAEGEQVEAGLLRDISDPLVAADFTLLKEKCEMLEKIKRDTEAYMEEWTEQNEKLSEI